jgi:acetoin utilization deacetylase AcuC-like enzyme/GNAT superfamily N-acetyltransferase
MMFRIRRVYDDLLPRNKDSIAQVQEILRVQFPLLHEEDITKVPEQLRNPIKFKFRSILWVAEDSVGHVHGFALISHAPVLNFCYLDFIATEKQKMGGGIGEALYQRVREEARALKTIGLFFECLPDDPRLCRNPEILKQNAARLRFYERYGARPIAGTAYETPLKPEFDNPPYLVYDDLGQNRALRRDIARDTVRAILERKYGHRCPAGYIDRVVLSFRDDPIRLREPKYLRKEAPVAVNLSIPIDKRIILVINDQHAIHHVREQGYVESPVRIKSILRELDRTDLFQRLAPHHFSEGYVRAVHDAGFVDYLKKVCSTLKPGEVVYPYVFPIRNVARPPKELAVRAGYYCIDTFTPLSRNAYFAARRSVDCALTAARKILEGYRLAYALVRPPGHHAERHVYGGFCYFNSTAIAAEFLSPYGKVAILDIDYHHGNGEQDIFYERSDVLTISIHGHPRFAFPYFSGFEDETGIGPGKGFNINIPLPEKVDGIRYRDVLHKALKRIVDFQPRFLLVALGLDPERKDPTGSWTLQFQDFEANGRMIGSLQFPTLVVQEGGYYSRVLGTNARHFFTGLWSGTYSL